MVVKGDFYKSITTISHLVFIFATELFGLDLVYVVSPLKHNKSCSSPIRESRQKRNEEMDNLIFCKIKLKITFTIFNFNQDRAALSKQSNLKT